MNKETSNISISSSDICRAWYEEKDFGTISKDFPLESSICCAVLFPTTSKEKNILGASFDQCKSGLDHYNKLFAECSKASAVTLNLSLNTLSALNIPYVEMPSSISDIDVDIESLFKTGLTLGNDLEIMSAILDKDAIMEMKRIDIIDNKPLCSDNSSSSLNKPPASTITLPEPEIEPDPISKRFKTARQEFIKDGGNISTIAKKTFSNSNIGIDNKSNNNVNIAKSGTSGSGGSSNNDLPVELQQFEKALVERIEADIIESGSNGSTSFDDIAGLQFAKKCVQEVICWPMLRPDLFTGMYHVNVLCC